MRVSGNYDVVDLTWFNQYGNVINNLQGDFVLAVDVADPPIFSINLMRSLNKPVYYVVQIIKDFLFPLFPFLVGYVLDFKI